jgi:hypothetical protein
MAIKGNNETDILEIKMNSITNVNSFTVEYGHCIICMIMHRINYFVIYSTHTVNWYTTSTNLTKKPNKTILLVFKL